MGYSLASPVGLNDDGSFCTNNAHDQQQVADLLMSTPLPFGGMRTSTGPVVTIQNPFVDGAISAELVGAIQSFQMIQSASLNIDLRVEPDSPTWLLLVQLATAPPAPTNVLALVILDAIDMTVEEAPPVPVSGLPSVVYTPAATEEQLVLDNGTVRITATFSGTITGSWGASIGSACIASPSINVLKQSVASGSARNIGSGICRGRTRAGATRCLDRRRSKRGGGEPTGGESRSWRRRGRVLLAPARLHEQGRTYRRVEREPMRAGS